MKHWTKLTSKLLFKHARVEVWEDTVKLPSGRQTNYVHYGKVNDAVTIIAINAEQKILTQKEYSYPPNEWLFQFPGGAIEKEEDPHQGAIRELSEETDLTGKLTKIGWFYPDNRRKSSKMHVFVATELQAKPGTRDPDEEFENYWMSQTEIHQKIKAGEIVNYSMLAAWALYKNI